jgi:hypothetical protein
MKGYGQSAIDSLVTSESNIPLGGLPMDTVVILCICFLALGIILGYQIRQKAKSDGEYRKFRRKVKQEDVDFDNIIDSAFDARPFAKKLKILCHPDRFVGDEGKMKLAEELHQLVEEKSRDLKELKELEKRIELELLGKK